MGVKCVHCGEDCGKHPILFEDQPFCCHGCKTVYQILNEKKLDKYYEIMPTPGIRVEQPDHGDKYAYLDLEEIRDKLLTFSDGGISKVDLFIPTIHCASCIWLLENLHTLHEGVVQSLVDFPKKKVSITFRDTELSLRQLVEILASIHYIPEITLDKLDQKEKKDGNRTLLLQIGIAGFSLLNVMLYNFPEYLPGGDELESNFRGYFGWLSLAVSLPVVLYSARDYYLSAFKGLKHKIINIDLPITLGIFTLFLQSTWDVATGHGVGYFDSLVGLVFLLLIGKWYQGKTYQALSFERDYKSYFPVAVTKYEGKEKVHIPLEKVKEGDRILIRNQELIPVDSTILEGTALIDYSFVTGESVPVPKQHGELVFAGGRQVGGTITLEVVKAVEQSYLTQLWNQSDSLFEPKSNLKTIINRVSEYFTVVILLIALSAAIYWLFNDPSLATFAFTSVLIIACPCALALTVPFTFGSTMRAFGRRGFYIKNIQVIENLTKIDDIVFDKTGTLTLNRAMEITWSGESLTDEELSMIKSMTSNSSHPLSVALFENIEQQGDLPVDEYRELTGLGLTGKCNRIRVNIGSAEFVTGKKDDLSRSSRVYVFIGDRVRGYFEIHNRYRKGLQEVLDNLKGHYRLYLISGDNEAERNNLTPMFGNDSKLLFNQSPTDKMHFITGLRESGDHILMIGDGLNDAGALMHSDVGITVADDIYSFSPACDAIIESGRFGKLHNFIRFSGVSINVVKISFLISFIYNVVGIYFAVQGTLSPLIAAVLMPLSSISVVAFATFAIGYMASRRLK
jgi:Cu+-exporting ATPase